MEENLRAILSVVGVDGSTSQSVVVQAPLQARVIGGWMMAMAAFGVALSLVLVWQNEQPWVILVPVQLWAWYAVTIGLRTYRLSVLADGDGLTIRNQLRTRRVPWADITSLRYERVWVGSGLFILSWRRWCGVVRTKGGRAIRMHVTTALSPPFGFLYTGARSRGEANVALLTHLWQAHLGNVPGDSAQPPSLQ